MTAVAKKPKSPKDPLGEFCRRLDILLDGGRPQWEPQEKDWLKVFRRVAKEWGLPRDTSFDLSFQALVRCHAKGRSGRLGYFKNACQNAHKDYVRDRERRRRRMIREMLFSPWEAVDARLDLEEALGRMDEREAKVLGWRMMGFTEAEIGEKLDLSERQVRRLLRDAERQVRLRLGSAYGWRPGEITGRMAV